MPLGLASGGIKSGDSAEGIVTTKIHEGTRKREEILLSVFWCIFVITSSGFEEILHEAAAFIGQDAGGDLHAMIHLGVVTDPEMGLYRPKSFIVRTKDETSDSRIYQRSGAHGARFKRRVHRRASKSIITYPYSGRAKRKYLGMGGRVVVFDRPVGCRGQYPAVTVDQDGPDRNLVQLLRFAGHADRGPHPFFVGFDH